MTAEEFYLQWVEQSNFVVVPDSSTGHRHWQCVFAEAYAAEKDEELQNEIAKKNDWRKLAESNQETATKALASLAATGSRTGRATGTNFCQVRTKFHDVRAGAAVAGRPEKAATAGRWFPNKPA